MERFILSPYSYDTYLAVVSTAANITKGITKKKNKNRIRPISITAIQNASNPSTGVSQNFNRFLAIRFNSLFFATSHETITILHLMGIITSSTVQNNINGYKFNGDHHKFFKSYLYYLQNWWIILSIPICSFSLGIIILFTLFLIGCCFCAHILPRILHV